MIARCINPQCALKFPLPENGEERKTCPRCGSSLSVDLTAPISQRIPRLNENAEFPVVIPVLDNLRSALNVGAILRTCEGAGIHEIYLCGITPTPANAKVRKTALGAEERLTWHHDWSLIPVLEKLRQDGIIIWALEGGSGAVNLFEAAAAIPPGEKIALIIGNEVNGVDAEAVGFAGRAVYLPMMGEKESLNAATAFGIAAYLIRFGRMLNEG